MGSRKIKPGFNFASGYGQKYKKGKMTVSMGL
jgi:hypothetical protein